MASCLPSRLLTLALAAACVAAASPNEYANEHQQLHLLEDSLHLLEEHLHLMEDTFREQLDPERRRLTAGSYDIPDEGSYDDSSYSSYSDDSSYSSEPPTPSPPTDPTPSPPTDPTPSPPTDPTPSPPTDPTPSPPTDPTPSPLTDPNPSPPTPLPTSPEIVLDPPTSVILENGIKLSTTPPTATAAAEMVSDQPNFTPLPTTNLPPPSPVPEGKQVMFQIRSFTIVFSEVVVPLGPTDSCDRVEAVTRAMVIAFAKTSGIPGIPEEKFVKVAGVTSTTGDCSSSRRLSDSGRRLEGVPLTAQIDVPQEGDPDDNANKIIANLIESGQNGVLVNTMKKEAQKLGVLSLELASADPVVTLDPKTKVVERSVEIIVDATPAPTPAGDDDKLPDGAIAAIIICSIVFVVGLSLLFWVFYQKKPDEGKPGDSYSSSGGDGGGVKLHYVEGALDSAANNKNYDV